MEPNPEHWRDRRVLVTGCADFLGSEVTRELLRQGAIVTGWIHDRRRPIVPGIPYEGHFHPVYGPIQDSHRVFTAMAVSEVSAIFHLADSDNSGTDLGIEPILRVAARYRSNVPVVTVRPSTAARVTGTRIASPVPLGIARFEEVFGPGDRKEWRVVPRATAAMLRGERAFAEDGSRRDFVFVRDAARACLFTLEEVERESESRDFSFRSNWQFNDREMIEILRKVHAGETLPTTEPRPGLANPLGWKPLQKLGEALGETIASQRSRSSTLEASSIGERRAA